MSMLQEGQAIPGDQWIQWDAESIARLAAQEAQGSDTASIHSENKILYDVDSDMTIDYDIVECESVDTNNNVLDELPDIKSS